MKTLGTETHRYTVFVNGKYHSHTNKYDWAHQRGLAIAMLKGYDFTNTKSPLIIDKWTGTDGAVIIQKTLN